MVKRTDCYFMFSEIIHVRFAEQIFSLYLPQKNFRKNLRYTKSKEY